MGTPRGSECERRHTGAVLTATRNRSRFAVSKMDCGAEERLVRMALAKEPAVRSVDVDLGAREITVFHESDADSVMRVLAPLNLGARLVESAAGDPSDGEVNEAPRGETGTLKIVLAINAAMFVGEAVGAVLADSTALLADSLDMFADAAVYGIALYGASHAQTGQMRAARLSGYLQIALAVGALSEVVRRALAGSEPEPPTMIVVALMALAANVTCMWLLARHRKGGAHMKASWIFTTNDVIANCGVIVAAVLVRVSASSVPDLAVGTIIALVVLSGAVRIMRLSR